MSNPETPSKSLIAQQLATEPVESGVLSDAKAMDLIRAEMSAVMWTPDTLDVIAAYVRGTGREILDPNEVVLP
jgi:hypothetical protein